MNTLVVAAAVIERDGLFLVTRRLPGAHLAGFWEFPGGKCEERESIAECLVRELKEELDADTVVGAELLTTTHEYDDRAVRLHFVRCRLLGEPAARLGQEMRWVSQSELTTLQFPPADSEVIRLLVQST